MTQFVQSNFLYSILYTLYDSICAALLSCLNHANMSTTELCMPGKMEWTRTTTLEHTRTREKTKRNKKTEFGQLFHANRTTITETWRNRNVQLTIHLVGSGSLEWLVTFCCFRISNRKNPRNIYKTPCHSCFADVNKTKQSLAKKEKQTHTTHARHILFLILLLIKMWV